MISWLLASHIVGFAAKSTDCDYLQIKPNHRIYSMDMGVAYRFLSRTGAGTGEVKGLQAENFAYLAMLKRLKNKEIAGE